MHIIYLSWASWPITLEISYKSLHFILVVLWVICSQMDFLHIRVEGKGGRGWVYFIFLFFSFFLLFIMFLCWLFDDKKVRISKLNVWNILYTSLFYLLKNNKRKEKKTYFLRERFLSLNIFNLLNLISCMYVCNFVKWIY